MNRKDLKEYFVNLYTGNLNSGTKLLREQEEEKEDEGGGLFDDAEEGGDEEGGDEEAAAEDEEGDPADNSDEEEKPELTPEEYIQYGSNITQELTGVFDDYAAGAMKTDVAKNSYLTDPDDDILPESITRALYEQSELSDNFDMSYFASEVARLIKNYDNLLDMESLIYVQAKEYLTKRFDDESMINEFDDFIKDKHGLELKTPERGGDHFAAGAIGDGAA